MTTSIDFDIEFNEIELVDAASDRKLCVSCTKYTDYIIIQCSLRASALRVSKSRATILE